MPNQENVKSPISLIAYGRSGTSLLSRAFRGHRDVDEVGETANLIFTPYRASEQIKGLTRFNDDDAQQIGGEVSRIAFLKHFPSDQNEWFQKPIGVPKVFWEFGYARENEFINWYWNAFNEIFPESRTFSVVRHPNDVFLSAREYWKFEEEEIWKNLTLMMNMISLGKEKGGIRRLYRYEDIVANSEETMRDICDVVEITFAEEMMDAFSKLHAPTVDAKLGASALLDQKVAQGFSRRDRWESEITTTPASEKALKSYENLLEVFASAD